MQKITAVLITREKDYPKLLWERLTLGFFNEIIVETESPSVYQRYLSAASAKNDIIYIQDDDAILNYQNLFKHYDGKLTTAMPKEFKPRYDEMGCSLVGWGCYFPKSALKVFDRYIAKYGIDKYLLREADRIFTYLNKPFNTIIMPHEDLPRANGDEAMWKEADHFSSAETALKNCKSILPPI